MDNRPDIDQGSYTVQSYEPRNANGAGGPRSSQANDKAPRDVLHISERHAKLPKIQSAADLQRREFPELRYIVPGIIAPGLTLFAGKPKIGKSWFCMDLLLSVSGDRYCLGDLRCDVGNVVYLA